MPRSEAAPLVAVRGAAKAFGGVQALRDASLELYAGEVHALLGENGAGKSTLLKALAGVHRTDAGEITVGGVPFEQGGTRRSREQGVAVTYQEPSLFPDLSLAENVFIGRQPVTGRGSVDWAGMRTESATLFAQLGVELDPDRPARGLSIADQQIVEIAKALSTQARVIVMARHRAAGPGRPGRGHRARHALVQARAAEAVTGGAGRCAGCFGRSRGSATSPDLRRVRDSAAGRAGSAGPRRP